MLNLKEKYPKLLSKIDEDIDELRYLIVVDENYDDIDIEEYDIFDPKDYSHIVYIDERVQNAIGKENINKLIDYLENKSKFEDFIADSLDNYGIKSNMTEENIATYILDIIEEEIL